MHDLNLKIRVFEYDIFYEYQTRIPGNCGNDVR